MRKICLQYYRDVLVGGGSGFGFRGGHVCQILDHLLGILRFSCTRFARAQNRLVLTICVSNKMKKQERKKEKINS
jgi:hypothetical protein